MHLVLTIVLIVTTVLVVTGIAARLDVPAPLLLITVGIVASFLPFVEEVHLEPEVVLFGLLPPLLYSAALNTSLVDFAANKRPILMLSIGLTAFTTVGVALVVHTLLPTVGWPGAFAIGAVVAPPDAVAATAIGRRIGLPRRIVTLLEGESLLNDATALVSLNTAIAALAVAVTWQEVGIDFLIAAGGGALVGLLFFVVVGGVRKYVDHVGIDTALGLLTPFAAYVAAEEVHASGVIAVVVAGLLLGHNAPVLQTAGSRLAERINWLSITFVLESAVFLLIGLQASSILSEVRRSELGFGRVVLICAVVLATVILLRVLWVFAARMVLIRRRGRSAGLPASETMLLGWAGMRGVVTLAAAFILPTDMPHRDVLLVVAFTAAAGTLFLQGLTLPVLARRLKVASPDPTADAVARANLLEQASQAGLAVLEASTVEDRYEVSEAIRERVRRRNYAAWERVGASPGNETPTEAYSRLRQEMLNAERARVLEIRGTGTVPHEVLEGVLRSLDIEESMLDFSESEADRVREANATVSFEGDCDHLRTPLPPVTPDSPGQCTDCLAEGTTWVHLRLCTTCGHLACCDSSPAQHASRHYDQTGHPVMRSAEPGEDWRWCFVDQLTG